MPGPTPTVGVPFTLAVVSNADGGTVTATITVTDGVGRYTLTVVNTGTSPARVVLHNPDVSFNVPVGETVLPIPGARRWLTSTFSVCSAARTAR